MSEVEDIDAYVSRVKTVINEEAFMAILNCQNPNESSRMEEEPTGASPKPTTSLTEFAEKLRSMDELFNSPVLDEEENHFCFSPKSTKKPNEFFTTPLRNGQFESEGRPQNGFPSSEKWTLSEYQKQNAHFFEEWFDQQVSLNSCEEAEMKMLHQHESSLGTPKDKENLRSFGRIHEGAEEEWGNSSAKNLFRKKKYHYPPPPQLGPSAYKSSVSKQMLLKPFEPKRSNLPCVIPVEFKLSTEQRGKAKQEKLMDEFKRAKEEKAQWDQLNSFKAKPMPEFASMKPRPISPMFIPTKPKEFNFATSNRRINFDRTENKEPNQLNRGGKSSILKKAKVSGLTEPKEFHFLVEERIKKAQKNENIDSKENDNRKKELSKEPLMSKPSHSIDEIKKNLKF